MTNNQPKSVERSYSFGDVIYGQRGTDWGIRGDYVAGICRECKQKGALGVIMCGICRSKHRMCDRCFLNKNFTH